MVTVAKGKAFLPHPRTSVGTRRVEGVGSVSEKLVALPVRRSRPRVHGW